MDLHDKVALVTGAARRIGREIALKLADAGCHLAIHYRSSESQAQQLASRIQTLGRRAIAIRADLRSPDRIEPLVHQVRDELGGPDLLINNASVFAPTQWGKTTAEEWLDQYRVNTIGPVLLAQACWPIFQQRGEGQIVNLSDIYAARPLPSHAAYSASKAALESATQSLARLMAPTVRVNAIAPGPALFPDDFDPRQRDRILARVPLQRTGSPADIASAVLYLLRDADYLTGQTITVDGGKSLLW